MPKFSGPTPGRPQPQSMMAKPGSPMSKLGPNVSTNQTKGSVQAPSPTIAGAELTTEMYTFFARPVTDGRFVVLYNGDRQAAEVILTLETAGPVAVATKQQLDPVLSGKGQQLETGVPLSFNISKGNRIYVAATSISRIKVTIQPVLWQEMIAGMMISLLNKR